MLEGIDENGEISEEARKAVLDQLHASFRPEFLNRLDETILFKPLRPQDITGIIDILLAELNERSKVKKVIAVVSGKGGVGKSLVTSLLACEMQRRGHQAAVLDADITGPSIPQAFGVHGGAMGGEDFLYANRTRTGIEIMSINLLLENETDPVIWRGPVISGVVQQFWGDVLWQDVDYMFVDMPPGTGDVALNVFQTLPVDGVIIVASPQELVSMVVQKAVKMAQMMNIPIVGLVENMSYITCPDCGKKLYPFGEGKTQQAAEEYGLPLLARMPIDPELAHLVDLGRIEDFQGNWLDAVADKL